MAVMSSATIPHLVLPAGEAVPLLGQGTWHMAERPDLRAEELAALRLGIELGLTLIDTAEVYAGGAAEELVGHAVAGHRDQVFLVGTVAPVHQGYRETIEACHASLQRLRTDRIDLYLLHWRGPIALRESLAALHQLVADGAIRYWGVSNFDLPDLAELTELPGGSNLQTNQVLYNLARRSPACDVLPWCRRWGIPVMAYSPADQGRLLNHPTIGAVAARHGVTPAQVALAWVLRQPGILAVPWSGSQAQVRDNVAALTLALTELDLAELDEAFPPPNCAGPGVYGDPGIEPAINV